jgi:hypothetical protein
MTVWAGRMQKSGAVVTILCALAHLAGHVANSGQPGSNASEAAMLQLMREYRIPDMGRSMQELVDGFSLTFTVMFLCLGLLAWSATKRGLLVITAAMLIESAIGFRYWFMAPNSFIWTATLCYALALLLDGGKKTG